MANTIYIAVQGDRWDLIAFRAYGDALKINELIDANPNVPITDEIPAGTILNVPVLSEPVLDTNLLPPWKR